MNLKICPYKEQVKEWPQNGQHILAQYDEETIVVYQAYSKEIGKYAASNGYFGSSFSYSRMSWIKPNFLWMMYRSGWATKPGQEVILAVRIYKNLFDEILEKAVVSSFNEKIFQNHYQWKKAVNESEVRLQWDPDHSPTGDKVERRAIQLGLRGDILEKYGRNPIEITDITDFVSNQRENSIPVNHNELQIPCEKVYLPDSKEICENVFSD